MKLDNKGFTLVEIMAGFSLLMVIMVSFVKIINLSSELTTAAIDTQKSYSDFYEKYYEGKNYDSPDDSTQKAFRSINNTNQSDLTCGGVYEQLHMGTSKECKVYITEIIEGEDDWVKTPNEYELKNIRLKKIENIKDTDRARIRVDRYINIG